MNLFKAIATFGGFTLLSRITGFLRDMLLANFLGAGMAADAFFVAFKLPNLFRSLFAEGAFTTAFVPMLSQKLACENRKKALLFASSAISILAFFVGLFVLAVEFLMPWVVSILAPGFAGDAEKVALATTLCRITFPFLLFISIVSFQSGILNSFNKFAAPAAAPVILNITIIAAIFVFVPFCPTTAHGLALGITAAGLLEIFWLRWFLLKQRIFLRPQYNIKSLLKNDDIKTLFKRIAPGILGAGIYQINMVVDTILVSLVGTGAISWLYYANRLQQLPLGVVGAAISVAVLPILSRNIKSGEIEQARTVQDKAVEYGAILSIPAAFALVILAEPIINILFQHGAFGSQQTAMTSKAVIAYAIGLPAYVFVKSLAPNFFARGDTKTPVKYSATVLLTNLVFAVILMGPFGHVGIASATTIAAFVSLWLYLRGLKKRNFWQPSRLLLFKIGKVIICSIIMSISLTFIEYRLNCQFENWLHLSILPKLGLLTFNCLISGFIFIISAIAMHLIDINTIMQSVLRRKKKI